MKRYVLAAALPVTFALQAHAQNCGIWGTDAFFSSATPEDIEYCVANGADLNASHPSTGSSIAPIANAIWFGNAAAVETMLRLGVDITVRPTGRDIFNHAVLVNPDPDILRALVEFGVDATQFHENQSALHLLATRRFTGEPVDPETVRIVLDAGVDIDAQSTDFQQATPLIIAIRSGQYQIFEALLAAGASVDVKDGLGATPLHLAASFPVFPGYEETRRNVIRSLIEAGASTEEPDNLGYSPPHLATGNLITLQAFLAAGVPVDTPGPNGRPMLASAASLSPALEGEDIARADIIAYLISQGADVNGADNAGWTALHYAAFSSRFWDTSAVIEALVSEGADANATDQEGRRPLELLNEDSVILGTNAHALIGG